jgi:hypothetical protein
MVWHYRDLAPVWPLARHRTHIFFTARFLCTLSRLSQVYAVLPLGLAGPLPLYVCTTSAKENRATEAEQAETSFTPLITDSSGPGSG